MSVRVGSSDEDMRRSRVPPGRPPSLATRLWDLLQPFARLWGITTAIVLIGTGAEAIVLDFKTAPLVIIGGVAVLILESMWAIALFVDLLGRRGDYGMGLRCWDFCRWSCARTRAPLYACGGTALLLGARTPLATIAGGLLLVLGVLRLAVRFNPSAASGPRAPHAGVRLLSQNDASEVVFYNAEETDKSEEMTVFEGSSHREGARNSNFPKADILLEL